MNWVNEKKYSNIKKQFFSKNKRINEWKIVNYTQRNEREEKKNIGNQEKNKDKRRQKWSKNRRKRWKKN